MCIYKFKKVVYLPEEHAMRLCPACLLCVRRVGSHDCADKAVSLAVMLIGSHIHADQQSKRRPVRSRVVLVKGVHTDTLLAAAFAGR